METSRAYGVPAEIVDAVNMMYTSSTDGDTESFEILA